MTVEVTSTDRGGSVTTYGTLGPMEYTYLSNALARHWDVRIPDTDVVLDDVVPIWVPRLVEVRSARVPRGTADTDDRWLVENTTPFTVDVEQIDERGVWRKLTRLGPAQHGEVHALARTTLRAPSDGLDAWSRCGSRLRGRTTSSHGGSNCRRRPRRTRLPCTSPTRRTCISNSSYRGRMPLPSRSHRTRRSARHCRSDSTTSYGTCARGRSSRSKQPSVSSPSCDRDRASCVRNPKATPPCSTSRTPSASPLSSSRSTSSAARRSGPRSPRTRPSRTRPRLIRSSDSFVSGAARSCASSSPSLAIRRSRSRSRRPRAGRRPASPSSTTPGSISTCSSSRTPAMAKWWRTSGSNSGTEAPWTSRPTPARRSSPAITTAPR